MATTIGSQVEVRVILEKDANAHNSEVRGIVRIHAPVPAPSDAARPGIDVYVLLDVSGSMNRDSRLVLAKKTIERTIAALTPADRLCIVSFSNDAHLVAPLTALDTHGKSALLASLKDIEPLASTFLVEGLTAMAKQAAEGVRDRPATPATILLLTDGDASELETDQGETRLLAEWARLGAPAVIHAVGISAAHNATFLGAFARSCRGTYVYVSDPAQIGAAVGGIIGGSMGQVSDSAGVVVSFDASVTDVLTDHAVSTDADTGLTQARIGVLYQDQTIDIPVRIAARADAVNVTVGYTPLDRGQGAQLVRGEAHVARGMLGSSVAPRVEVVYAFLCFEAARALAAAEVDKQRVCNLQVEVKQAAAALGAGDTEYAAKLAAMDAQLERAIAQADSESAEQRMDRVAFSSGSLRNGNGLIGTPSGSLMSGILSAPDDMPMDHATGLTGNLTRMALGSGAVGTPSGKMRRVRRALAFNDDYDNMRQSGSL